MSTTDRGEGSSRAGDARTEDAPPRSAREAEQDAADLGEKAADNANQPGTATDQAESRVQEAVQAAQELADQPGGMNQPGRRVNRRSPFWIGMAGAFGVAVTYGLVELFLRARSVLVIVGLALFIAVGLDPVVSWLTRRGWPRWAAVLAVLAGLAAIIGGFLAAAVPPLTTQTTALAHQIPTYIHQLQNHNSELGKLNDKYHIQTKLTSLLSSKGSSLIGGVLGAGVLVISTFSEILGVIVLTIYFLAGLPSIKLFFYRLIPHSRRPRVILITDQITVKVGGYVLGNVLTSAIAGFGTFIWMIIFGIPYPALLGLLVAILDLVPVIGSTIGGFIVTLIALTVSLPVAIATLIFYVVYRLAEDYLIVPRIMGRTVELPAVVSLISVLVGGVLLGIVGALVAIPVAAAINLILREVTFPRMDRS
ncbi:MAG TPA: AI-2E family transporter [Streptosporangiaceae bacterium]|jgi:predicted PurR-regulated permease PerM|nr:AI-2E family transporter [Streptosporangiaceae bacterium]